MKTGDEIRANLGLAVSLRDMGNGKSRLFFDDVKSREQKVPTSWDHDCFYTFTPEFENESLDEMNISNEALQDIGAAVVARLLAINGRIR